MPCDFWCNISLELADNNHCVPSIGKREEDLPGDLDSVKLHAWNCSRYVNLMPRKNMPAHIPKMVSSLPYSVFGLDLNSVPKLKSSTRFSYFIMKLRHLSFPVALFISSSLMVAAGSNSGKSATRWSYISSSSFVRRRVEPRTFSRIDQ